MANAMGDQDAAIEGLEPPGGAKGDPDAKTEKKEMPAAVVTISTGMDDIAKNAGKDNEDYQKQMDALDDDEEMQKWMAKQKG